MKIMFSLILFIILKNELTKTIFKSLYINEVSFDFSNYLWYVGKKGIGRKVNFWTVRWPRKRPPMLPIPWGDLSGRTPIRWHHKNMVESGFYITSTIRFMVHPIRNSWGVGPFCSLGLFGHFGNNRCFCRNVHGKSQVLAIGGPGQWTRWKGQLGNSGQLSRYNPIHINLGPFIRATGKGNAISTGGPLRSAFRNFPWC